MTASIAAGCPTANALARGYVYQLLADIHVTHYYQTTRQFVDDMPQRFSGTREHIEQHVPRAACFLVEGLAARGISMSGKSVAVSSDPQLAVTVSAALKDEGIAISPQRHAKYLGTDASGGARRPTKTVSNRHAKCTKRAARARTIVAFNTTARRLWKMNTALVARDGGAAQGVAPSSTYALRVAAAKMACLDRKSVV